MSGLFLDEVNYLENDWQRAQCDEQYPRLLAIENEIDSEDLLIFYNGVNSEEYNEFVRRQIKLPNQPQVEVRATLTPPQSKDACVHYPAVILKRFIQVPIVYILYGAVMLIPDSRRYDAVSS
ncbi:hypothetical protein K435DRAFT_124910 [Dendrothele bispora CBS 962.96]|uniref:Uncharacterized protein n=1 Tax=Dendrothele bispora (strain CBS 962.96) TaxID=1314807 RepID=A0A4S8M167_DENBC|nr:hypothetical protein K435DRAFT_124910 [Dendrothele bispora CBS 962.96]